MNWNFAPLASDVLFYFVLAGFIYFCCKRKTITQRAVWQAVFSRPGAMAASIILGCFLLITTLDCIHFQVQQKKSSTGFHSSRVSALDYMLKPIATLRETTYSAPLARELAIKSNKILYNGKIVRTTPHLKYVPQQLSKNAITTSVIWGLICGIIASFVLCAVFLLFYSVRRMPFKNACRLIALNKTQIAWRAALITITVLCCISMTLIMLGRNFHVLGTDQVGNDILYECLKSIRTGVLIGTLTTMIMLPFALLLGPLAGYMRGWVDDCIQYLYTTLSAIPGVLLIAASILSLQLFLSRNPQLFNSNAQRADIRLICLCAILGITSWTTLCRLLRAEALKLREVEYVQAAKTMRVKGLTIIIRHIMPNIMHIVIITLVLDFSGLVLAEAVLSYVGVGVDPTMISWGQMINSSRLELARAQIIWWPLASALVWMFSLVLSANILSDAVRDALDPYLQSTNQVKQEAA